MYKKSSEEFIKEAKQVHDDKYNYDKVVYFNNKIKIIITCPVFEHGDFLTTPYLHINKKSGCKKCHYAKISNQFKKPFTSFLREANDIHNNKYIYDKFEYKNSRCKSIITCPIHGDFLQCADKHIVSKQGCPKCGGRARKTLNDFINKANDVHNNKYDYSKFIYINCEKKSIIICPIHGDFLQTAEKHILRRQGCPACAPKSYGEKLTKNCLNKLNYVFNDQFRIYLKSSIFPKKIDFYIESLNLFIEFNGAQHYQVVRFAGQSEENAIKGFALQKARDEEVREYCKINNINLLEINILKSEYNKGENLDKLEKYINKIIPSYIFKLKSKMWFKATDD